MLRATRYMDIAHIRLKLGPLVGRNLLSTLKLLAQVGAVSFIARSNAFWVGYMAARFILVLSRSGSARCKGSGQDADITQSSDRLFLFWHDQPIIKLQQNAFIIAVFSFAWEG